MTTRGHHGLLLQDNSSAPSATDWYAASLYTGDGAGSRLIPGVNLSSGGVSMFKPRSVSGLTFMMYSETGSSPLIFPLGSSTAPTAAGATFGSGGTTLSGVTFNTNTNSYINHSIRKQAGVLDIVPFTGNGANRTISHSLGVVPGVIMIVPVSAAANRYLYHAGLGSGNAAAVNGTGVQTNANIWNATSPTSSVFSLGTSTLVNMSARDYIAICFGDDNSPTGVINAYTYAGNGSTSGPTVNTGWEPGFIWALRDTAGGSHWLMDQARTPLFSGADDRFSTDASSTGSVISGDIVSLSGSSGFTLMNATTMNAAATTYYGMAIRDP